MDKDSRYQNWVLIKWPKIPQTPQNMSVKIVCLSPKVWGFNEEKLLWRPYSVNYTTVLPKGPSIKDVGLVLAFFDNPLPHIEQNRLLNDPPLKKTSYF